MSRTPAMNSVADRREEKRLAANPIKSKFSLVPARALLYMAQRMAEALTDHDRDSWKLIGIEGNVDHAAEHLFKWLAGDRDEDHLGHAFLRLAFAWELKYEEERRGKP